MYGPVARSYTMSFILAHRLEASCYQTHHVPHRSPFRQKPRRPRLPNLYPRQPATHRFPHQGQQDVPAEWREDPQGVSGARVEGDGVQE